MPVCHQYAQTYCSDGKKKRTGLLFGLIVLTLVPQAAPCLRTPHVSCA